MKFNKLSMMVMCVFLATSWIWGFWSVQPFDFDESFYRRVAEEMLVTKNYLWTTYGFEVDTNKPPGYIWLVLIAHFLTDADILHVSALASRLVSILFTFLTVGLSFFICWRKNFIQSSVPRVTILFFVVSAFSCLWFPTIGAGSVLIDPALTFFSMLAIYFLNDVAFDEQTLRRNLKIIACALVMFFSSLLKGPVGIVLPLFFLVVRFLFLQVAKQNAVFNFRQFFREGFGIIHRSWALFALGFAMLLAYYAALWNLGAKEYVYDFIVTHNLKRAVVAREGHGGQFFYYILILLVGGAPLLGMLFTHLAHSSNVRRAILLNPWFSWFVAVLVFYSVAATKLPNYIWPAWPALVICFLGSLEQPNDMLAADWKAKLFGGLKNLCCVVSLLLGLAFLGVPLLGQELSQLPIDERARMVINALGPLPSEVQAGFYILTALFLITAVLTYRYKKLSSSIFVVLALISGGINIAVKEFLLPFADNVLTGSVMRLTQKANAQKPELFAVIGHQTPTAYSFFEGSHIENFSPRSQTPFSQTNVVVLTPLWHRQVCLAHGFSNITQDYHMLLCQNP